MKVIAVADFAAFTRAAVRTRLMGLLAAALALGLTAGVLLGLVDRTPSSPGLLPKSSEGIVVVDVSASISWDTYARIASTLDRVRRDGGRAGLVLFSDTAYQALPPGTPVAELERFERYFKVARPPQPGYQPQPPRSPWTDAFSAGTRISTGLRLALDVVRRDRPRRPAVLLVSDLDDDAGDLESLTSVVLAYRRLGVPIRVVGLNPSPEDERLMERLLPKNGVVQASLPGERRPDTDHGIPVAAILLAVAAALALAALLTVTERVRWAS